MLKKTVMILLSFFCMVHAQENTDIDTILVFDELVYKIGMNLAEQEIITDSSFPENVLLKVCQQVPEVAQIVQMFLILDEEMVAHEVQTPEQLIHYLISSHHDLAMAGIIWAATFQNVFVVFKELHQEDVSYQAWCEDVTYLMSINSEEELQALGKHAGLYEACALMLEAQMHLEYEFKLLA